MTSSTRYSPLSSQRESFLESCQEEEKGIGAMANSSRKRLLLWLIPSTMIVTTGLVFCILAFTDSISLPWKVPKGQVNEDPDGFSLEHVMIVHRHGLRAPSHLSNWSNADDYPMGLGYLTKRGKEGSLLVGEILRRFYKNFLIDSPREVWARSSTYPRCFETEFLLLSTMFPPKGIWRFGFPVQPVTITMVPDGNDVYIESCTAGVPDDFKYMYNETHPELQEDGFETFGDFMKWLEEVSGYSTENSKFYEPLIDGLYAQRYNGLKMPEWAEKKWKSMDWALRRLSFDYWKYVVPYYGQYMGKTIASRMKEGAEHSLKEHFSMMSYHDTTIQAIFSALKFDYVKMYPSFLAALHFQLYKKKSDGQFYVRTLYSEGFTASGTYQGAKEITIKDCPFPNCPVETFAVLMEGLYQHVNRTSCPDVNLKALL